MDFPAGLISVLRLRGNGFLLGFLLFLPPALFAGAPVVQKIEFIGNRTEESVLRRRLPFTEGDSLDAGALDRARQSLLEMRLFKQVFVSSSSAPGGARVTVALDDGWYLIPFPFYASGSGGSRGGLLVSSRNIFRHAESVTAMGFFGGGGSRSFLMASREGWSLMGSHRRQIRSERFYEDGGWSASAGFGAAPDEEDPVRFGRVAGTRETARESAGAAIGCPLGKGDRLTGWVGWESLRTGSSGGSGNFPDDPGHWDQLSMGLEAGHMGRGDSDDLGVLLGFGLADIAERIKPLRRLETRWGARINAAAGGRSTGADGSFSSLSGLGRGVRRWGRQNRLSVTVGAAQGRALPRARRIATDHDLGLMGNYAREFRGHSGVGGNLSYSRPFRPTERGLWQGLLFAEGARVWSEGKARAKTGLGVSVFYRFWRFPLPLGVTFTRSLDDRDTQVSAAVGGRF